MVAINRDLLDVPASAITSSIKFLTKQKVHDKILEIGSFFVPHSLSSGHRAQSDEQSVLRGPCKSPEGKQLYEHELGNIPSCIIAQSIQNEKENYTRENYYTEVRMRDLPPNANIISSHHFFEIKTQDTSDRLCLKCCLAPHGIHDDEKEDIRKDMQLLLHSFPSSAFSNPMQLSTNKNWSVFISKAPFYKPLSSSGISISNLPEVGLLLQIYIGNYSNLPMVWLTLLAFGSLKSMFGYFLFFFSLIPDFHQLFHIHQPCPNEVMLLKVVYSILITGDESDVSTILDKIQSGF